MKLYEGTRGAFLSQASWWGQEQKPEKRPPYAAEWEKRKLCSCDWMKIVRTM